MGVPEILIIVIGLVVVGTAIGVPLYLPARRSARSAYYSVDPHTLPLQRPEVPAAGAPRCGNCQAAVVPGDRFCGTCGHKPAGTARGAAPPRS